MKLVSACLAGVRSRFDGTSTPCQEVIDLLKREEAIPVCPEQLGGLATPRPAAERLGDRVLTKDGEDVTERFGLGAEEALKIALLANCKEAILKSHSPSCGSGKIYDGTFSGKLVDGDGVLAELLRENGVRICTEKEICRSD